MRKYAFLITLFIVCLTQKDLKDAVCDALCKTKGNDYGQFIKRDREFCSCSTLHEFDVITEKRIIIKSVKTGKAKKHRETYSYPIDDAIDSWSH